MRQTQDRGVALPHPSLRFPGMPGTSLSPCLAECSGGWGQGEAVE